MIRTFKSPRFLKVLFGCSFAVWLTAAGASFYYDGSRPEAPIPERGQIYELNTHGQVVYISVRDGLGVTQGHALLSGIARKADLCFDVC